MKSGFYILICLLFTGLISCDSWLDVKPQTEVAVDDMFANQQGFQDALIGVYLDLKHSNAYGQEMMYGTVEYLAQHWDCSTNSVQEKISRYNYIDESVQNRFGSIYSQLYKVIASANMVLERIDGQEAIFEPGLYGIIKGEALAIRAYCHLDLLRLFGPMPSKTGTSAILPYVTSVTIDYHRHHTYEEFARFLETDILLADSLLKRSDPVRVAVAEENTAKGISLSIPAEDFLRSRHLRFNYYAVKALEARFYLWLGDSGKSKAYSCAKEVIDAMDKEGKPLFTLGTTNAFTREDYAFSSEHIFAIYNHELYDKANSSFGSNASYTRAENVLVPDLYVAGTTDIRSPSSLWIEYVKDGGSKIFTIKKFYQKEKNNAINQLPMLRLAEMYLIAIECGTLVEANGLYKAFCIARDIPVMELGGGMLKDVLIEQYNKEFYGEGQVFYTYKRLEVENILWAKDPGNEDAYVVPLPRNEVDYSK